MIDVKLPQIENLQEITPKQYTRICAQNAGTKLTRSQMDIRIYPYKILSQRKRPINTGGDYTNNNDDGNNK